jgi:hypothetical protein
MRETFGHKKLGYTSPEIKLAKFDSAEREEGRKEGILGQGQRIDSDRGGERKEERKEKKSGEREGKRKK